MTIKTLIGILFTALTLFAFSNRALAQTINTTVLQVPITARLPSQPAFALHPPAIAVWQDKSSTLPGTSVPTIDYVVLGVAVATLVTVLIVRGHAKHHANPPPKLNAGIVPNLNIFLTSNSKITGVSVRYAFK